jgi:hypothetical protein
MIVFFFQKISTNNFPSFSEFFSDFFLVKNTKIFVVIVARLWGIESPRRQIKKIENNYNFKYVQAGSKIVKNLKIVKNNKILKYMFF